MRWLILTAVALYALVLFVAWSLCRVAALSDVGADDMFDLEPAPHPRPCPLCTSSNVYVDTEAFCFCATCRASYPITNTTEAS